MVNVVPLVPFLCRLARFKAASDTFWSCDPLEPESPLMPRPTLNPNPDLSLTGLESLLHIFYRFLQYKGSRNETMQWPF